jgi:hypothetical protein
MTNFELGTRVPLIISAPWIKPTQVARGDTAILHCHSTPPLAVIGCHSLGVHILILLSLLSFRSTRQLSAVATHRACAAFYTVVGCHSLGVYILILLSFSVEMTVVGRGCTQGLRSLALAEAVDLYPTLVDLAMGAGHLSRGRHRRSTLPLAVLP